MTPNSLVDPTMIKIVILGEGGIGKTALCKTCDRQQTYLDTTQTIAVEFHIIKTTFQDINYRLQVWDLGGQNQFKKMGIYGKYCKGIQGAVACFDLTDVDTLFIIPEWLSFITDEVPVILVGTKGDLAESDDFIQEEVKKLVDSSLITGYIETSALNIDIAKKVFTSLLAVIIKGTKSSIPEMTSNHTLIC